MPKVREVREETAQEKRLREWFEAQELESPKNLEDAARLLIGLGTGLIGTLFGVLTVSAETLPAYLALPLVKVCGVAAVGLWLLSLLAGLAVVLPFEWKVKMSQPEALERRAAEIVRRKARWLIVSAGAFGLGVLALGIVLATALITV